jgi:hypothetical protein
MNTATTATIPTAALCDVCHAEPMYGACAVPGLPATVAYGLHCLRANAHPYPLMVMGTVMHGGYGKTPGHWQLMVDATLARLGIDRAAFDRDVAAAGGDGGEDGDS